MPLPMANAVSNTAAAMDPSQPREPRTKKSSVERIDRRLGYPADKISSKFVTLNFFFSIFLLSWGYQAQMCAHIIAKQVFLGSLATISFQFFPVFTIKIFQAT